MGGFEHLEHTADVGIRAWDESLEGCFRFAALGLLDISGTWKPGASGERVEIELAARDPIALMVDWLSEIVYLHDARDAVVTNLEVHEVTQNELRAAVELAPRGDEMLEGTAVKAITYHQLTIEHDDGRWTARIYVDV